MIFSSIEFIFRFLPMFLLVYIVVPKKVKLTVLLLSSLIFYMCGEQKYFLLFVVGMLMNYGIGCFMECRKSKGQSTKAVFLFGVIYNVGILFFFKYANFFWNGFAWITRIPIQVPSMMKELPLGISFYTFTMISYLADVERGQVKAERNLLHYATYIGMFPQLLSGPIVRYEQIKGQLNQRIVSFAKLESGLKLFVIGLSYKVIIADQLATLWHSIQTIGFESISTKLAWLGVLSYSLQLYFDFNGYSLMAIGVGEMLGFSLPVNFVHPYMARSVGEFWRRWHITLGQWFKDYVYIPLGGNRKGKQRQLVNLLIVWLLTGLWHGAGVNFLLWGFSLFVFIACEKLFLQPFLLQHKVISRIYVLLAIGLTWMLFAITEIREIGIYFGRLFPLFGGGTRGVVNASDFYKYAKAYAGILSAGVFLSTPIAMKWYLKRKTKLRCILILLVLFWYSTYLLMVGESNPFMYFRF